MKRPAFPFIVSVLAAAGPFATPAGARDAPAPPLSYTTTWIGNRFGGGPKWVQNFIEGMYVAPDGTVYCASGWDEGGREFGFYKNGDVVGQARDTHGWGTVGGTAVTASDRYVFLAHSHGNEGGGLKGELYPPKGSTWYGVSRRNKDGSHAPFPGGKGRFGDMLVLHESDKDAGARGLALDRKTDRLYVSDAFAGEIKVFDAATMKALARWKLAHPRQIAVDPTGNLWVLQDADPAARAF